MEIKENTIFNCDCMELMNEMVKQNIKVDWCITDPPYGINIANMSYTKDGSVKTGKAKAKRRDYSKTNRKWDNSKLPKKYFDLIRQISNNQIIFGGNYYADYLPPTGSWLVWDKRCDDSMRNDFADCELAWCSKGVARVFHYLYNGMLQGDMKNRDDRFHPTQKPTQIWIKLLNYYTKYGDVIFDPFAGSCSLAVACHKTGRKYICCEIDKDYYEKGTEWLNRVKSQITIFDLEE